MEQWAMVMLSGTITVVMNQVLYDDKMFLSVCELLSMYILITYIANWKGTQTYTETLLAMAQ